MLTFWRPQYSTPPTHTKKVNRGAPCAAQGPKKLLCLLIPSASSGPKETIPPTFQAVKHTYPRNSSTFASKRREEQDCLFLRLLPPKPSEPFWKHSHGVVFPMFHQALSPHFIRTVLGWGVQTESFPLILRGTG